jgi:hypothetical protein
MMIPYIDKGCPTKATLQRIVSCYGLSEEFFEEHMDGQSRSSIFFVIGKCHPSLTHLGHSIMSL